MSEGLERLREIGVQKIHEATHIARHHIQDLLDEGFESMTKIQILGFISILQREYGVDLSEYKAKALEYYSLHEPEIEEGETRFFVSPTRKKRHRYLYVLIAIVIFALAIFFNLDRISQSSAIVEDLSIDNSAIESAKVSMSEDDEVELKALESETLQESNSTVAQIEKSQEQKEELEQKESLEDIEAVEIVKSFKIKPKSELWIGYIDRSNYKKYQKLFSDELELDPNKEWLLSLGHGYVTIEIDGEMRVFNDRSNLRLLYKDSKLSKISFKEFKELNRGQKW